MIAVFDLDKTLINEDSTTLWSQWLCQNQLVADIPAYLQREQALMQQYEARQLDIADYIKLTLQPVIHLPFEQMDILVSRFIDEQIKPRIYLQSLALLRQHQQQGDAVLIISASAQLLVGAIGQRCFHVEHAYGIDVKKTAQHYTTELAGIVPYQAGKVDKLREYTHQQYGHFADTYFYSDSINDEPLLQLVQFPQVINPDSKLHQLAQAQQWPIHYFEKTVSEFSDQSMTD